MKKLFILVALYFTCFFLINNNTVSAQDDSQVQFLSLTAFTTDHSLRLEVTFNQPLKPQYNYQLSIFEYPSGRPLIENITLKADSLVVEKNRLIFSLQDLKPKLWEPEDPQLYLLNLNVIRRRQLVHQSILRIGFRTFCSKNGQIWLNNRPIFLRGIAINPPGRGIPSDVEHSRQFAEDYVRFMKSINVNIIRIPDDQTWYDVCDELGMMVFGGNYSGLVAGQKPPESVDEAVAWYQEKKFRPIANHPSLMIYALTNEVPYRGDIAIKWRSLLSAVHEKLQNWDSTRLYIGNAGYGYGQSGDICDLHRYWGWYYASPFTFIHTRNNEEIIPFDKTTQPVTFTECVGNYTGPDGRYNLTPHHKNPVSQLCWTGHAPQNIQAQLADEHQAFTLKTATELFRRLRSQNPELSGIFPFTILFHNWHTARNLVDMDPKFVTKQVRTSYEPILLSWELWTSQVYAGNTIKPIVHIVNDDNLGRDLTNAVLYYGIKDETATYVVSDSMKLPGIDYYSTKALTFKLQIPQSLPTGKYSLYGRIVNADGIVSENQTDLFIAGKDYINSTYSPGDVVKLLDPSGKTASSLDLINIPFKEIREINDLGNSQLLLIGPNAVGALDDNALEQLKAFVEKGGCILALRQDSVGLMKLDKITGTSIYPVSMDIDNPIYPPPPRPSMNGFNINPEIPGNPIFSGITREELRVWSDYTDWDEKKAGMPAIYPVTNGFILKNKDDIAQTSILANYSVGLEGIALAAFYSGKGSVLVSGFDIINRSGLDPVADRLLKNMVSYMGKETGHNCHPMIVAPIRWGEYETESGLLTGIYSGLLLNSKPKLYRVL